MVRASVALVDGDASNCQLLREICQSGGWDVAGCAHDASQGLALLAHTRPDWLITDFKLAGEETGLHLIASAKRMLPQLFTMMLTGWDINDVAAHVTTHQPDRMLRKPMPPHRLMTLLEGIQARGGATRVPA